MMERKGTAIFDLSSQRALITGSSQGIGKAIARALAEAGAKVVLNGRDVVRLDAAVSEFRGERHDAVALAFDVTDHAAVRTAVDGFESAQGAFDILVNNAGMQKRGPLEDYDWQDFDRLMRTNVSSVFNVGQAVARHMITRGQGKIINIASVQSALSRPGIAPYTASKGAVANLTKGMATDWGPKGLQINAIAPGYFKTPLNQALIDDAQFSEWLAKRTPAGRWGNLEELAGASIFLASQGSSFMNGQTIYIDGGITACL